MSRLVWTLARRSGLLAAWRRRHRRSIAILSVHGVMDDGRDAAWRPLWERLHIEHFERGLALLQRYYEFIPLGEAVQMLRGERPSRPHCMVLTFDDGYRNNFTHALPVLERLRIPATFFVCSGMVGTNRCFWIDRLDYAIQRLPRKQHSIPLPGTTVVLDAASRESLGSSYLRLRLELKARYRDDFDAHVNELASDVEHRAGAALTEIIDTDPWASLMTWEQAHAAQQRGIEIGSHTVDHVRLNLVQLDVVRDQLLRSRSDIEQRLHTPCAALAYPNGDYSAEVAAAARRAGYRCAVTTERGLNEAGVDPFTLRRVPFPNRRNPDHFLALASGFHLAATRLRDRRRSQQ